MNTFAILSVVFAFACLQLVSGNVGPAFEIKDGNCTNAVLGDLVFQDHVHRYGIPFVTRDDVSHWAGDQKIYCVMALSQKDKSVESTAVISEGGVNHTFLTIKFQSVKGEGYEYNLQVFGKL